MSVPLPVLFLAILSIVSALSAVTVLVLLKKKAIDTCEAPSASPSDTSTPSSNSAHSSIGDQTYGEEVAVETTPPKIDISKQCLFVVFNKPGKDTNEALAKFLKDHKGFYEKEAGAYHIPAGRCGYTLLVASATSPGKLPALPKMEASEEPIKGVSILVRFVNMAKAGRNPDDLLDFMEAIARLGNGRMLNVDYEELTEEDIDDMREKKVEKAN